MSETLEAASVCTRSPGANDTACRCSPGCRALANAARWARDHRARQGVVGRIPARECRAHVEDVLLATPGSTVNDFSRASGVSEKTLRNLMSGRCGPTLYISTADRIFDVEPGSLRGVTDRTLVSGERTAKAIDTLVRHGWSINRIAEEAGLSTSTLMPGNLDQVYRDTEKRVLRTYQRLPRDGSMGDKVTPALVARRMVESLMVLGWSREQIARHARVGVSTLARGEGQRISAEANRRIRATFMELRYKVGPSQVTASRARKLGYAPWAAWPKDAMVSANGRPDPSLVDDPRWRAAIKRRWSL